MKYIFTYILLFSFIIRPVYSIGYISYYGLNLDYIVKNYCINKDAPKLQCNGKCHLNKQLNLSSTEDSDQEKSSKTLLCEAFMPVFFQEYVSSFKIKLKKEFIVNNWMYCSSFTSVFQEKFSPPPRV